MFPFSVSSHLLFLSIVIFMHLELKDYFPFRPNARTPGKESDSPLPSIQERLSYLRPSRELLEFYRQKIAQFDEEHEELLQMLEKHRGNTEDQVRHSKVVPHFSGACVCEHALTPSPFSISCSGTYSSVRGRLWSCRMLWVTCRSTFFKKENRLSGFMQKTTVLRSGLCSADEETLRLFGYVDMYFKK